MNVLFLTIGSIGDAEGHSIYLDLLREFRDRGHTVYCVSPNERKLAKPTAYTVESGMHLLRVKVGNLQKCGMIEKGISTLLLEGQYKAAVKKYFRGVKFDLVLYSTPPITLCGVIRYIKQRDGAKTYLMLKDIFPQNALDMGILRKSGWKGMLYRFFRKKEKKLYALSDRIGCMSQANADYVLKHNPEIPNKRVEIFPNSIEFFDKRISAEERAALREKYGIPQDKKVFVYGGNLGRPQGIPFVIDCLRASKKYEKALFLIVGAGTEYSKLESFVADENPENVKLFKYLPKEDYDRLVAACDVGLIFLDHRFTIPNFPSRLLAYMQAGLPVLAATDPNTDIGKVIVEGGFGWWCESNAADIFVQKIDEILRADLQTFGVKAKEYLLENYTVQKGYNIICSDDVGTQE